MKKGRKMDYEEYFDRVYGCWLGKCICGSIGAPLEGCKQLFHYQFDPAFWRISLPNDDLELQILWLNVIEEIGLDFDADDLAAAFLAHVPYNPGEYAYFKRNYRRGIHPPTSGIYNNHYYHEGMGCCIRAEIWACLAAGDPELAARICRADGQIDHSAESIYSESFIAAMEAAAFVERDLDQLIAAGLAEIPAESKLAGLVRRVSAWCEEEEDWRKIREMVLRHYGHPDCTNMFQNIGITLTALKKSGGDLEKATLIALNSGYDTDCTCGIAGAVLGIISGAEKLQRHYGIQDTGFVTGFELNRPSNRIEQLARDVARLVDEAGRFWNRSLKVTGLPPEVAEFRLPKRKRAFRFQVEYDALPVIAAGGSASCRILIENLTDAEFRGTARLVSDSLTLEYDPEVVIPAGCVAVVVVAVCHGNPAAVADTNLVRMELGGEKYEFGFAAAVPYRVYGPCFGNFDEIGQVDLFGVHYDYFLPQGEFINRATAIRNYHLNSHAGLELALPDEAEIISGKGVRVPDGRIAAPDDLIPVDSAFGCSGPAVFYLVSEFETPIDMEILISVGHSGPMVFWLDGRELVRTRLETWRTPENLNLDGLKLPAGRHRAVFKVVRQGEKVTLSINYKNSFRPGEQGNAHCTNFTFLV